MKLRKIISLAALILLIGGSAIAVQGCFEESYGPGPGYGYGSYYPYGPSYAAAPPVVLGDWDEHHAWHDRDWWVENRRPWVEQHHHEWLQGRAAHPVYGHRESPQHHD